MKEKSHIFPIVLIALIAFAHLFAWQFDLSSKVGALDENIYLAGVLGIGILAQWLAWRFKLPAIVLLLVFGFELGYWVGPPESYVGEAGLLSVVSLAVGVILFEGGLSLHFKEIKETGHVIFRLVTVGLLITWGLTACAAHWFMAFSWPMAILLGALLTVSGPTVILPLLRQVRPTGRIGSVMKWEGIVNDPIGAVLAALVFEVVAHGIGSGGLARETAWILGKTTLLGITLGACSAWLVVKLFSRYMVPDYLQNPVVLAIVVLVYAWSNYLQEESGLVTVTVLGLVLANQERTTVKHVIEFKENLRVLLISILFIVLSSRISIGFEEVQQIGFGGIAFLLTLILFIRPLAAYVATFGSELSRNERLLLAWIHPRGIVAAAVASLFAIGLTGTELESEGNRLVMTTFLVIVGTVTTYGLTLGPIARRLGLSRENPQGILFAGASPMVRQIATTLQQEDIPVLLVDTNPQNVAAARMSGLSVHYASIGSEFVHQGLDLSELGRMLAMTPNDEVNSIAAMEFRELFGSVNVFQLAPPKKTSERHRRIPDHLRGRVMFGERLTYEELTRRINEGAVLKKTTISEDFTYSDFLEQYGPTAIIMFEIPEPGKLRVGTVGHPIDPKPSNKILALIDPPEGGFQSTESGILG